MSESFGVWLAIFGVSHSSQPTPSVSSETVVGWWRSLSFIFQKGRTSGSHAILIQNLVWESGQLYEYCMNEDSWGSGFLCCFVKSQLKSIDPVLVIGHNKWPLALILLWSCRFLYFASVDPTTSSLCWDPRHYFILSKMLMVSSSVKLSDYV